MLFNFPTYGVSFDYEIFPNASCTNPASPPSAPSASGKCSVFPDFTFKTGDVGDVTTYLCTVAVYDWPERVAIDNLRVNVPEPGMLVLLGAGLAGLCVRQERRK